MKRLLLLLSIIFITIMLSGCIIDNNTGYVVKEEYDATIDVTTLTVFDLDRGSRTQDVEIKITGTEYSHSEDGYVCYSYKSNDSSDTELINWEDCS